MLTDEQLEIFGDRMAGLYQAYEQDVISDIARRVKKTGRYTETAELMAQQMYEAGMSPAKIQTEVMKVLRADKAYQDEVAQNTLEWKKYVKSEIEAMEADALAEGNMIIAEAGDMSFNYDMAAWERAGKKLTKDSAIAMLIEEMGKNTNETFKNLTNTMAFKGVYNMMPIQDLYIKSLDKAVLKMATGTFSFDQCVNDLVRELAQSGLRSVDYASGRTYQIDTAARMAIRTSCSQLAGKISMRNCEATGTDLVEVSAHWGAREDHAIWQGKIYSLSGKSKKYPDFAICRYGEVDGLKGVNCRHDFYPFFEGISEPTQWPKEPEAIEYKGRTYTYTEATQKQRQMERNVRATKREIEAQKVLGGDIKILEAKKRKQIAEYHEFSNAMEIRPKDNRLRVASGTSDLNKKSKLKSNAKSSLQKMKQSINEQIELLKKYGNEANILFNGSSDELIKWSELKKITNKSGTELLTEMSKSSYNWETILNMQSEDTFKTFINQLLDVATDEELSALNLWSGETYANINRYMRYGINVDDISKNAAKKIEDVLDKIYTNEEIIVHRGTGTNHMFEKIKGDWKSDPTVLIGESFHDAGFVATSPLKEGGFSGVGESQAELFIRVPKGTHGAYIAKQAHNENEKEFLLQRGYSYRIIKAEYRENPIFSDEKDLKVWCEVILND